METVFLRSFDAREREKQDIYRLYVEKEMQKIEGQKGSHQLDQKPENADDINTQWIHNRKQNYEAVQSLVAEITAIDKPIGVKSCWLSGANGKKKRELRVSLNDLIMDRVDMEQDALDPEDFSHYLPLDNRIMIQARNMDREASLGILAAFPNEVVDTILLVADIQTLTTLRAVNTYIRDLISDMPQYKNVYEHGINALRAMLATGAARYHSIRKLHSQLRSFRCSHCLEYRCYNDKHIECGNQLYLLTCERYCYDCSDWLWKNRESVINEEKAIEYLGAIDSTTLEGLPYITYRHGMSPRDKSTAFNVKILKGERIYMQREVIEAMTRRFGAEHTANTHLSAYIRELARPIPYRNKEGAFRFQLQKTGCAMRWLDRASQFFFVGLPALENPRLGLSDWGSVCKGCFATRFERDIWHPYCEDPEPAPLLSSSEMLEHLRTCEFAAELRRAAMNPSHKKHEFYSIIVKERYPSEPWRKGLYQNYIPSFHHEWDDDVDDSEEEDDIDDVPNNIGQANHGPEFPQVALEDFPDMSHLHGFQQGPNFIQVGPILATQTMLGSDNMVNPDTQFLDNVAHQQQPNSNANVNPPYHFNLFN